MRSRPKEPEASELDSLLGLATDREKERIGDLLRALEQSQHAPDATPSPTAAGGVIAKTLSEAGKALGVDERTVARWARDPTFPGKVGASGKRNGRFPIAEIQRWRGCGATGPSDDGPTQSLRLRKLAAETLLREVDIDVKRGHLVDREQAEARIVIAITTARSLLEELPEQIAEALPASQAKLRRIVRRVVRRKVLQTLEALAERVGD